MLLGEQLRWSGDEKINQWNFVRYSTLKAMFENNS